MTKSKSQLTPSEVLELANSTGSWMNCGDSRESFVFLDKETGKQYGNERVTSTYRKVAEGLIITVLHETSRNVARKRRDKVNHFYQVNIDRPPYSIGYCSGERAKAVYESAEMIWSCDVCSDLKRRRMRYVQQARDFLRR